MLASACGSATSLFVNKDYKTNPASAILVIDALMHLAFVDARYVAHLCTSLRDLGPCVWLIPRLFLPWQNRGCFNGPHSEISGNITRSNSQLSHRLSSIVHNQGHQLLRCQRFLHDNKQRVKEWAWETLIFQLYHFKRDIEGGPWRALDNK